MKQEERIGGRPPSANASTSVSGPPIRPPATIKVVPVAEKEAAEKEKKKGKKSEKDGGGGGAPKPDSKFGGQLRSGPDYYQKWDKFAEEEVKKITEEEINPDPRAVKAPANTASTAAGGEEPVPTTAGAKGATLTSKLIQVNADLTPVERAWHAEQEKIKGNESFRCVHERPQRSIYMCEGWGGGPCVCCGMGAMGHMRRAEQVCVKA